MGVQLLHCNLLFWEEWFALELKGKDANRGFGIILIPYHLGSLGAKSESEAVIEVIPVYATSSVWPSIGVILSTKVSDSISNFDRHCVTKRLPAAQNFPKVTPTAKATNSQTSIMSNAFIASPPFFHGERNAMNMPTTPLMRS